MNDVLVAGAGIVGVSVALHLQREGRSVVLLDRQDPGEETSYGNAGLIERASVVPFGFPRDLATILCYALNCSTEMRFHWPFLIRKAPWLARFWYESSASRLRRAALDMLPLIERSVDEHLLLMTEAGMLDLLQRDGWLEAYRSEAGLARGAAGAAALNEFGLKYEVLDGTRLRAREPHLSDAFSGAVHWLDPATVSDPGRLVKGYARLFSQRGGAFIRGDAMKLRQEGSTWSLATPGRTIRAREAVVALGPWSDALCSALGYNVPLLSKRGYHAHFRPESGAMLNRPLLDTERGYVLAPMRQGIRLTTGIEFAPRDHAATPVQLDEATVHAREVFPLKERVERSPWVGSRPCLPDMRPVIGPAPRHKGLWFAFGHNHHGLTLGPATGRLLSEMMTGKPTFADAQPFAIERFL